jgi:hypothetical protein
MSAGMASGPTGFPFPQQPNQSQPFRKDSLHSLNNERQAPSRFDSTSSGGSTSAVSVALQSSTPDNATTPMARQNSTAQQNAPPLQGYFQFQAQMPNYGHQSQGFASDSHMPGLNTFPPTFGNVHSLPTMSWNPYNGYTTQMSGAEMQQSGMHQHPQGPTETPLVSRSSSTSTHHSAISPAMLSNMPSRMPNQSSAFAHLPDDDDVLVTVNSSAAPSEYGGPGLSSRNPSPEITKRDRKRRAMGPQGSRRMCDNDMGSDAGSGEDDDAECDVDAEGVEKNGMMWGMKTEEYKALSARERKRVRNRISARTFRARRKGRSFVVVPDHLG